MHDEIQTAHFFWHGPELSCYEHACIASFLIAGFHVKVWSYQPVRTPQGAQACDAAAILPATDLTRYTQAGHQGNIAAFTDFFRYELLRQQRGWWFDTDVVCLKPQADFRRFAQPIVAGYESTNAINGAVLRLNDPSLAADLKQRADSVAAAGGNSFAWGAVGPALVKQLVSERGLTAHVVAPEVFYPLHWRDGLLALDPERAAEVRERCRPAHTYHFWNEVVRRFAIPKNMLPPEGSFLHEAFVAAVPALAGMPALPVDTFRALVAHANSPEIPDPGFMHHLGQLVPSLRRAVHKRLPGAAA